VTKASEAELSRLHGALARGLTDIITDGVEVPTKEGSVKVTAPAAYFGVAVALLKNNNITADPEKNEELRDLNEKLQARRQNKRTELNFREAAEDFATKHLGADVTMN
jgi:hypothetical protein